MIKIDPSKTETERVLEKCPPSIDRGSISLRKIGGYHRQKNPHNKGRVVAARSKRGRPEALYFKEETRIKAACIYAVTGSAAKTGEILGIKSGTIRQWKLQPWWQQVIDRIRNEKDDELDVKLTRIIDKSVEVINDRLENGDYIYDLKKQELVRKPMNGKETAVVTSIMVDKRALIREKKQIHREEGEVLDRIKKLQKEFENMGRVHRAKDVTPTTTDVEDAEIIVNAETRNTHEEPDTSLSETSQINTSNG